MDLMISTRLVVLSRVNVERIILCEIEFYFMGTTLTSWKRIVVPGNDFFSWERILKQIVHQPPYLIELLNTMSWIAIYHP